MRTRTDLSGGRPPGSDAAARALQRFGEVLGGQGLLLGQVVELFVHDPQLQLSFQVNHVVFLRPLTVLFFLPAAISTAHAGLAEIFFCMTVAIAIFTSPGWIAGYQEPDSPAIEVTPRASSGQAFTEAPRGTIFHRYAFDEAGTVTDAKIVPPTSQNQRSMEEDLAAFVPPRLHLSDADLRWQCEQAVRNYDPCISCSTHFLKLERIEE